MKNNRNMKDIYSDSHDVRGLPKKYTKKYRITINTILSVCLVVCILFTGLFYMLGYKNFGDGGESGGDQMKGITSSKSEDVSYFLVTGTDESGDLTDIIMIVCFDIKSKTANILQIPRDTYIGSDIPTGKVNAVYESAKSGESRINVMMKRINEYFGLPIDHYIVVSIEAFRNVVDTVGGIDVNIPVTMNAYDSKDVLHHIEKGEQHLNGGEAEAFIRHRNSYAMGDLGRVEAQRNFYAAFIKAMLGMSYSQMATVAGKCYDDFSTDMKLGDLLSYAKTAKELSTESISFFAVPGQSGTYSPQGVGRSYYSIHKQEYVDLINEKFLPYEEYTKIPSDLKIEELHSRYYGSYLTNDDNQGIDSYIK